LQEHPKAKAKEPADFVYRLRWHFGAFDFSMKRIDRMRPRLGSGDSISRVKKSILERDFSSV
jgi:hypothetical protein